MNILYLCADRGIPIRGHKGAAVHVRALSAAFVQLGHHVTILTPRPGPVDGPPMVAEMIVVPLPPRPAAQAAEDEPAARERQSRAYADVLYAAAREQLERCTYSFIYERYSLWSDVGARLAKESGLPLVLEVNAPLRLEAARFRSVSDPAAAAAIEATQFLAAHAVSAVSQPLCDYVIARGVSPERAHLLPNAVDPRRFHPGVWGAAARERYNLDGRIVVGFVGRPRPWHDLQTLCAALAELHAADPRYHLLLVGEMPPTLPAMLAQLGLSPQAVTQTGPVPHDQVPEHIAAMDVAVSPHPPLRLQTAQTEIGFYFSPLKVFEYLACGAPTVVADVGRRGLPLQDGETGCLYPAGDASALADCVRGLIEDPPRARRIGWQGAVAVLGAHTWEANARAVAAWVSPPPPGREPDRNLWPAATALPILDRRLRQRLYRASRPDLAAPLLARRLPAFGKHVPIKHFTIQAIEVLKYKAGRRCVLAYEVLGQKRRTEQPTRHNLVGKVYRDDRGRRLFQLQLHLWQHGFGPEAPDRIYVPRPLAYVPEMRMFVQERAAGATLNDLAVPGVDHGLAAFTRRSAQGLAKLHAMRLPLAAEQTGSARLDRGPYTLTDECDGLDRFAANLAALRPDSAREVVDLRDALHVWARQLAPAKEVTPLHRDFYYSQVLFDDPSLTLLDFDLLATGDPAMDLANFVAHLYFLGLDRLGRLDELADEAALFVEAYAAWRPVDQALLQRLAFYQAATFFRLLHVVAPRPRLAQHFDALYRHTARCLENA